jgi:superfamily I DNA/RNA helicase
LNASERALVFSVFEEYNRQVFERGGYLDADDLALTLLSRLSTPLWQMRRREHGFHYVFVDETQLFNENERRLFHYLTRRDAGSLPIALALDEAQELQGNVSSGFGLLGISAIADAQLRTVYRSTESILRLAFHIIQRTTDLFGVEFPNYTTEATTVVPDTHKWAAPPTLLTGGTMDGGIGKFVVKHAERLRGSNLRQVCIVVHAERYYDEVATALRESRQPLFMLARRGEHIDQRKPVIVLTRPPYVGGQEFDAVIAVGIEAGQVPPDVKGHDGLRTALAQQALREMYLSFTRARYRLYIANKVGSTVSTLLTSALADKLLRIA